MRFHALARSRCPPADAHAAQISDRPAMEEPNENLFQPFIDDSEFVAQPSSASVWDLMAHASLEALVTGTRGGGRQRAHRLL